MGEGGHRVQDTPYTWSPIAEVHEGQNERAAALREGARRLIGALAGARLDEPGVNVAEILDGYRTLAAIHEALAVCEPRIVGGERRA